MRGSFLSGRRFISGQRLLIGFVLSAAPVFAQESAGSSGGGAEKPSMLLWQVLNFFIIAGLIGYLAVKQGGPLLAARSKEIGDGLAAGEKAKAEADARAKQVQAQLANLDREVAAMRTTAREEREREADRIRRDAQKEMNRIRIQAEHEVESAGKMARLEVQRVAAKMAIELAERKVRASMSPEIQAALLQGFLSDLPRNGGAHSLSNVE
jgi:F-type H+-transporting ATPase subunit b